MRIPYKNLLLIIIFNSSLFVILMIGIQNSFDKSRVNLTITETVNLPISFIIGTSFIFGSLVGGLLSINSNKK